MTQVGLVVVSHSRALAEAAVELALIMVHGDKPPLEIAAGTDDGGFGTDAVAVMEAIMSANQGDGVAVFTDLGSALTSTDMALEMLADMGEEIEVRVLPAPFVEGLTAAVVRAALGSDLDTIESEAVNSLAPKLEHLGVAEPPVAGTLPGAASLGASDSEAPHETPPDAQQLVQVVNRDGLHARPAAAVASLAQTFPGEVMLDKSGRRANAKSPISIATLAVACGDNVQVLGYGEQAEAAVTAITKLIASGFGEERGKIPLPDTTFNSTPDTTPAAVPAAGPDSKPGTKTPTPPRPVWHAPWETPTALKQ